MILRSATKALSAAGERMAVLMAFDKDLMTRLVDKNINFIGHAPRSSQLAYAETMKHMVEHPEEQQHMVDFYQAKVEYVEQRLRAMGANMPDSQYKVQGTFYVLGDFSELFGLPIPPEAERALGKTGPVISSNEELAYSLLFEDGLMLAPMSYCGLPNDSGVLRITCSGSEDELKDLMDRLEARVLAARQSQDKAPVVRPETPTRLNNPTTLFRQSVKNPAQPNDEDPLDQAWRDFVEANMDDDFPLKASFLAMSDSARQKYKPWRDHLESQPELKDYLSAITVTPLSRCT